MATYRLLPVGSRVALDITLPDGHLVAHGTVRWIRDAASGAPAGLGIAFEELHPVARLRIARFSAAREPLLYDCDAE